MSDAHDAAPVEGAANAGAHLENPDDKIPTTPAEHDEARTASEAEFEAAFEEAASGEPAAAPAAEPAPGATPAAARDAATGKFIAAPAAAKPAAAPAPAAPVVDPWKDAPPELLAARDETVAAATKGHRDQIARRTREADKLKQRIAELEQGRPAAAPAAAAAPKPAPAKPGTPAAAAAPAAADDEDAEVKAFREEYPEVAGPVLKLITGMQTKLNAANGKLAAIEGRETARDTTAQVSEQVTQLEDSHPDWRELTGEPNGKLAEPQRANAAKQFIDWLDTQPTYVRDAAKRNGEKIVDAEAASDMIDRYKAHLGVSGTRAAAPKPAPAPAGGGAPPSAPARPAAAPLDPRRQNQLRASSTVPARGPGAATGVPDDFEAAFNHFAGQK